MKPTTLAEDYLNGFNGSVTAYHRLLESGQRIGQAFFNALSAADQSKITGTRYDPFHYDDTQSVESAVEFLLRTKP